SWILRLAIVWNFGTLFGAAVLGVWWRRSEWRRLWIFYAMAFVYAASVVLFYVFARYRFVLVPPLALLAGAAVSELTAIARRRSSVRIQPRVRFELVASAIVFGVIVADSQYTIVPRSQLEALMRFNTGAGLQASGRTDDAIAEYRAAAA